MIRSLLTTSAAICLLPIALAASERASRKPNVLVIVSDDHRHDALSVVQKELGERANYPFFKTPQLDRLASSGIRFRNAFVTHSLCSPSRATMLTGQHTHLHGIVHNAQPFNSTDTWPAALAHAGWKTGFFGKWHMGVQRDRPGFQEVATFLGQGTYENCPFIVDGVETPSSGWVDDVTTSYAIDFMRRRAAEPFALFVGFKTPHDKRTPPERHAALYQDVSLQEPASFKDVAPWRRDNPPRTWSPKNQDRLAYFQTLAGLDDNMGRLLDALDDLGIAEDTLVIYAGDNGYYLGEHGLGDKRTAYEESIRIPFLLRYPARVPAGEVRDELVLNLDFAATILDFCGVSPSWVQQGASLAPLLAAKPGALPWRKSFLYTNYEDPAYPRVTFDVLAVRTETHKYVEHPGKPEWTQLFDLRTDPYEMKNRIEDPDSAALLSELRAELAAQKQATGFTKQ